MSKKKENDIEEYKKYYNALMLQKQLTNSDEYPIRLNKCIQKLTDIYFNSKNNQNWSLYGLYRLISIIGLFDDIEYFNELNDKLNNNINKSYCFFEKYWLVNFISPQIQYNIKKIFKDNIINTKELIGIIF